MQNAAPVAVVNADIGLPFSRGATTNKTPKVTMNAAQKYEALSREATLFVLPEMRALILRTVSSQLPWHASPPPASTAHCAQTPLEHALHRPTASLS